MLPKVLLRHARVKPPRRLKPPLPPACVIDEPARRFLAPCADASAMETTPRYADGNTRDPRNPPDDDLDRTSEAERALRMADERAKRDTTRAR